MPRRPQRSSPDAKLAQLVALAQKVVGSEDTLTDRADRRREPAPPHESASVSLRASAAAALELAAGLRENLLLLGKVVDQLGNPRLLDKLLDLPTSLSVALEHELALEVADRFAFIAREKLNGDAAVILARAGRRDEALARVTKNLETAADASLAEAKAGDAYRELHEWDSAEAYYRRSLALAKPGMERAEAALRVASLLIDTEREADAAAFLHQQRSR